MLKRLASLYSPLVVLTLCIGAVLYLSRYADNRKADHSDNAQSNNPKLVITPNSNSQSAQDANKPHQHPNWIDTFEWPEGATAWALFLTLIVIGWQSTEARKAAESAERQIGLQSVAMRQWVNVEPIGTVTPRTFGEDFEVTLQFVVHNRTDYLITVKKIVTEVFTNGKARIFSVSCGVPVPPEKSGAILGHPFYVTANVNRHTWDTDGHPFVITGEVAFLDCMMVEQHQAFQGFFIGYADGRLVERMSSGIVPDVVGYELDEDGPYKGK